MINKGSIREYCKRVLAICKKLGLEPMIWSDMYITANTNGGYYEVPADADCSSWEKPEKGLGLVVVYVMDYGNECVSFNVLRITVE